MYSMSDASVAWVWRSMHVSIDCGFLALFMALLLLRTGARRSINVRASQKPPPFVASS